MSEPTSPVSIRLLGAMEASIHGAPLPHLRSRKGHWLLALLALRGGSPVLREWLAATLWSESVHAQALTNLRMSLTDLRRALGPEGRRLHAPASRSLALDLTDACVDLPAFDAAIARGDETSLQQAIALYRGPLLEGCTEAWVIPEREARERVYLEALERLASMAHEREEWTIAERHLRAAVATDPLREVAQRALMRALAAGGNFAAALQVYQDLCRLLHRELNALPDPETTALFRSLRDDRPRIPIRARKTAHDHRDQSQDHRFAAVPPRAQSPGCHGLPLRLTRFIGREREMREVSERLAEARLVTLTGAGGCGKSRLAVEVANRLASELADGVRYVELAALVDPALVAPTAAGRLGIRGDDEGSCVAALITHLCSRDLLLVLDNCEHLIEGCVKLVAALLAACPKQRILATSREALGITGEVLYRVPSLTLPQACRTGEIDEAELKAIGCSEAGELFVDRACRAAAGFTLNEATGATVAAICRRLDGMPLAIELAAARLRAMSLDELHRRLDDRFRLLVGSDRTALPRHRMLRATIDWSYELLSEPERAVLRRLSVFAGGCTLEAAEAVDADLDRLTALVDKSLVDYEEREEVGRYRLLETVRQYGRERLREAGEEDGVRNAHLDYFLALVERAEPEFWGATQPGWTARIENEHDNIRAALNWSVDGGAIEKGLRLGAALRLFWEIRCSPEEGRRRVEALLARFTPDTREQQRLRGRALLCAGSMAWLQADFPVATRRFQEGLAIGRALDDMMLTGWSLCYLTNVTEQYQENAATLSINQEVLGIAREIGDESLQLASVMRLGNALLNMGELTRACAWLEEGMLLATRHGDHRALGFATLRRGQVSLLRGDLAPARAELDAALALAQESEWPRGVCAVLIQLGSVAWRQGDLAVARHSLEEALALARERGFRVETGLALRGLGEVAQADGDFATARARFGESLTVFRTIGQQRGVMWAFYRLARLAADSGQAERAARLAAAATALREAIGLAVPPIEQPEIDGTIATAREALGEAAFARTWDEGRAMSVERAIEVALANGDGSIALG